MAAELHIDAGPPAGAEQLRLALATAGVAHGVDAARLAALAARLEDPLFTDHGTIARGTPARPGRDGRLALEFAPAPLPGFRGADGSVDYRERAFLHPAAVGAVVARLLPPVPGQPGTCVLGRQLPAPPARAAAVRLGPGVTLRSDADDTEDGAAIVATRDGVVATPSDGIDVVPLYEHDGDVDLRCGNLHSHGAVAVRGDVATGFCVEADGDVDVGGSVFGGTVLAGGSVRIGLGAMAGARVEAGGELRCRHASNATLLAKGRITAHDELVHCEVAAAAIELVEGRGHVLGGALRARDHVTVLRAGTPAGAATLLAAADLTSERAELRRRQRQADHVERRSQKAADRAAGPQRGGKVGRARAAASAAVTAERLELARQLRELLRTAHVEVRTQLLPGVRVQLGTAGLTIDTERRGARFRWDDAAGTIVQEDP